MLFIRVTNISIFTDRFTTSNLRLWDQKYLLNKCNVKPATLRINSVAKKSVYIGSDKHHTLQKNTKR